MKLPLLVLVGPTGVGKTAIAVEVARRVGAEIISGDSMQVYRGMDIGTAKVTPAEMAGVVHHLIDIRDPDEPFSVAEFQGLVDQKIREVAARGHLPFLVGGTGLYVRAVLQEYQFTENEGDPAVRARLAAQEEQEPGSLRRRLEAVDPAAAAKLHANDLRRTIRALEVYEATGRPISAMQFAEAAPPRYDDLFLGLTRERAELYDRIDRRVDAMLTAGWLDEVRRLLRRYSPDLAAMQSLGYRELVLYLRGMLTLDEAVPLIKRNTRRFAKRQFTWFKREQRLKWLDLSGQADQSATVEEIVKIVEGNWRKSVERH